MLLENFTATLNKLMCYNENYQKHIHTFLVYFITIFLKKQGQSSNIRHQQPLHQLSKFSTSCPRCPIDFKKTR